MNKNIVPITNHLVELKYRTIYSLICLTTTFLTSYIYSEQLMYLLTKPLLLIDNDNNKRHFIYTDLSEAFLTYIKISIYIAILLSLPYIIYQIWLFLAPGLYKKEKLIIASLFIYSIAFFVIGAAIAYYIIFPVAWAFFISFEQINEFNPFNLELEAKINEYVFLVFNFIFVFGLAFQFPILILFLIYNNIISEKWFLTKRNYICLFAFIIAALISPPDILSQILIVIPLLFFYELTIFIIKLVENYENKAKNKVKQNKTNKII